MSRPLLRHPAVVAGVMIGLVAVIVLNVRTFAPGRALLDRGAERARGYLVPPDDLGDVVHEAVYGDDARRGVAVAGTTGGSGIARDPFSGASSRPAPAPRRSPAASRQRERPEPLVCTAVMLGGAQPLALVDGAARRLGDRVRGHEIVAIRTDGVRLRRADGDVVVLSVGPATADSTGYHVVTGRRVATNRGETRLATDPTERTQR